MAENLWRAISEAEPGLKWVRLFDEYWPDYKSWWLREGVLERPTYVECRRALEEHMPEIMPLYDQLCDIVGGGDLESRFLSFFFPPAYLSGCSQAVWPGEEPVLVRNYDYNPKSFDSLILKTNWQGRRVMGVSDGLWGLVDGVNDAGLAVSLTFGGRKIVGKGFGIPLIIRYLLQTCETAEEAGEKLKRLPSHMSYNITVLDKNRRFLTAYMAPNRETTITRAAVATNHQETVDWIQHARLTATVERERYLLNRLTLHVDPEEKFINAFLKPPLYSTAYKQGFGTLYTAVYRPRLGQMEIHWPGTVWPFEFDNFQEAYRRVRTPDMPNKSGIALNLTA